MGNITKKFASIAISVATVASLSGFALLVPVAHAQTDLQAQINALLAQIAALQSQLAGGSNPSFVACNFTRDLTVGVKGDDVMCLQRYLNDGGHAIVGVAGTAGSSGYETTYFGAKTSAAVASWQAANGVAPAVGYFGPKSRAKYAALSASAVPVPPGTPAPTPVGSGLTVSLASDQPAAGLFGESFASRPFTKLVFRASADGDVTVKALTVERQGQGADAAFSGVVDLDEDGIRLGSSKTFGSDHRARLTDSFVVKAGQTRTITLAGDSDSDQDAYAGQLVSLALVGVEVSGSSAVNASYPMVGNLMTVNSTLSIGSVTLARGAYDPGSGQTKEVGTVGYRFTGLRLNAGTNEDVLVKSIRLNQSGSAAASDLANVKIVLDGVSYDTMVSADGKYYTAKFGSGIKIEKGLNKELHVQGDVVNGSNRTVDFDLYRYEDLQVTGLTYGYSLSPTASETGSAADDGLFHASEPRFDAYQVQIGTGSISVQNATTVGAQNVAINLPNQPLGGIVVDVKGEDITVAAMNFDAATIESAGTGGTIDTNDVTNITLVDENGAVVAGPVDGVAGGNNAIRFSDTVTFKVGRHTYTLKGKYNTDFSNGDTVAASTTPSSDWTTVRGTVSGVSITPTPASAVTTNTMTVRAAALVVTLDSNTNSGTGSSTAQTVVAGVNGYEFTRYVLDASGSGEDVKLNSMKLRLTFSGSNSADDLTNCQLWDGATALTTGTNTINPTNSDTSPLDSTFSLDTPMTLAKGTIKILSMKCNLISGAKLGGQWSWGIASIATNVSSNGAVSGQSITETGTTDNGRIITAASGGSLAISLDSSSPSLKWLQAGTTDNTLAVLRLNATNEAISVNTLGLQIATSTGNGVAYGGMASNTPNDLSKVTVWNGSTKVGEAVFSASDFATATLTGVTVPKDDQVLLTIKGDIGNIGIGLAARPGHLVVVNYDADNSSDKTNTGAVGVGLSSGLTIGSGGSDSASNGARIARSIPTISKLDLGTSKFANNTNQTLYKFSVSAPSSGNGVSLYKMTFEVATSSTELNDGAQHPANFKVTNFRLYCYSDSGFSSPSCNTFDNSGLLNQGGLANASHDRLGADNANAPVYSSTSPRVSVLFNPTDATGGSTAEAIRVSAGTTKYFALIADATGGTSTPSISTKMDGDATFSSLNNSTGSLGDRTTGVSEGGLDLTSGGDDWSSGRYIFATTAANVDAGDDDDFIWSGNATNTSQSIVDYDWFNGFLVPGLSNGDTGLAVVLGL